MSRAATACRAAPARWRRFPVLPSLSTAAALAAAVFSAGCAPQQQRPNFVINPSAPNERIRAADTSRLKAGRIFEMFARAEDRASDRSLEEQLVWLAERQGVDMTEARREEARRIGEKNAERSLDDLTWSLAAAFEGTLSAIVQIGFVRKLDRQYPGVADELKNMSSTYHSTPNKTVTKPLGFAVLYFELETHGIAEALKRFPTPPQLAGRYALATKGRCDVIMGRYELVQQNRVLEIVGNDRIAMYGVIGASRAFFVPTGKRYARIARREGKPVEIRVPDKTADIMSWAMDKSPGGLIAMTNKPEGNCVVVMKAIGSET